MGIFNKSGFLISLFSFIFLLCTCSTSAQKPFKVFLIGDAGDFSEGGATLNNLKNELNQSPNSAVVFLGDNSYKDVLWGLFHFGFKGFDSSRNTIEKIMSQLDILKDYKGSVYFTPGNHDWWNKTSYEKGRPKLAMEESFIEKNLKKNKNIANPNRVFLPQHGNYGPDFVELNDKTIRIIFIDTYRIIQTGIKKNKIPEEEKAVYRKLDSLIQSGYRQNQKIFVVAHHPVHSIGPYNRPLTRPYFQERIKASMANFPSYQSMSDEINKILIKYPGIYYASGHIHALQYFYTPDSIHYIISGAGSKENKLSAKEITKYEAEVKPSGYILWNSGGFFEIAIAADTTRTILHYNDGTLKCTIP